MTSFIIVAKEKAKRETYAKIYAKEHQISTFDITLIEKDTDAKTTTKSIGIENVKLIQKKLYFKPINSIDKLVIIEDAHLLTPEAQNALLKVLEEPPDHTIIMLAVDTQEALLPTILSRCHVIILEEEQKNLSEKKVEEITAFINTLDTLSVGERLKKAEQLTKDKDKAVIWIENAILLLRKELLDDPTNTTYLITITSLQSLHTLLKTTNVNPRFAIEQTLLSMN